MFISLIVPTMRVGGLDILFDSLAAQDFTDFELVLVDGLYQQRKEIVAREARDRFLRVVHVGLNPNPFPNAAFCRYANAGIVASSGEVLLFMVDYSRLPSGLIGTHATFHKADPVGNRGLMGPHQYVGLQVDVSFQRFDRGDVDSYENAVKHGKLDRSMWSIGKASDNFSAPHHADGGAIVPHDADPKLRLPAGEIDRLFFHAKNESVRREHVLKINGWDQDLDGAHLYQDSDFADRLTTKAGVEWTLDPGAVVDIVNPRHVFPFARRSRPHEDNFKIWQRKKDAGYPDENNDHLLYKIPVKTESGVVVPSLVPVDMTMAETPTFGERSARKLRVAMIYGEFSSAIHGPFDLPGLYKTAGLTGSESSFFNLARTLSERGHEVVVFCKCEMPYEHPSGFHAVPITAVQKLPEIQGLDAVIAWNEPDYLSFVPAGVRRICDQQLNDFGYCRHPDWRGLVDRWVSPSDHHLDHLVKTEDIPAGRSLVIPNSVDLDLFNAGSPAPARQPHRVVYCSSPDRGLHHLLGMWPLVRKRVPDAELGIFYRLEPWLARARDNTDEVGRRARYIETTLPRLFPHGVKVIGPVSNTRMASQLMQAAVLAYPCDPVRYTEGFGCSVLDATAGGCIPIISNADALPSVHKNAALVVDGKPVGKVAEVWADTIANVLLLGAVPPEWTQKMIEHARAHSRQVVADKWEALLFRA